MKSTTLSHKNYQPFKILFYGLIVTVLSLITVRFIGAQDDALAYRAALSEPTTFGPDVEVALYNQDCIANPGDRFCYSSSSPVVADITGDGNLEVIAASIDGIIKVIDHNGTLIWQRDTAPFFGMAAGTQRIRSSPAIADIDDDGTPEIIFGTGTIHIDICTQGGVMVLDHNGNAEPGWPKLSQDEVIAPTGCTDTIYSTPSVGDIDADGDLEIVAGGFDRRLYMWHHDGTLQPGFPIDSYMYELTGWGNLKGQLADTVWGSPALADMTGNGELEIILATDEGMNNLVQPDWRCDVSLAPGQHFCGGSIYVVDKTGKNIPGWPKYIHEAIQSSPAVADLNLDGKPEVIVGTGTFYYNRSSKTSLEAFKLHVFQADGSYLPGWDTATTGQDGGKELDGPLPASPAIGDIDGDGVDEVVAIDLNGMVYAIEPNGDMMDGFPKAVKMSSGRTPQFNVGTGTVLADYNDDGDMEIFVAGGWHILVMDGDGKMLTSAPGVSGNTYLMQGTMGNVPTIADLDKDGDLDFVATNSKIGIFHRATTGSEADWGMFRRDASRSGNGFVPEATATISQASISKLFDTTASAPTEFSLSVTVGVLHTDSFSWSVANSDSRVTVSPATGSTSADSTQLNISVDVDGLGNGNHSLAPIELEVTLTPSAGGSATNQTFNIPVDLTGATLQKVYLAVLR